MGALGKSRVLALGGLGLEPQVSFFFLVEVFDDRNLRRSAFVCGDTMYGLAALDIHGPGHSHGHTYDLRITYCELSHDWTEGTIVPAVVRQGNRGESPSQDDRDPRYSSP
jgi:hypothetical protein